MLADTLFLVIGLALLLVGGEGVVRGASGLARALGVSPVVVGLTVVAFCTSAPELAVNSIAAWNGRGELSFGSIIGSNLANIGLILGVTAVIQPLLVQWMLIVREIPMMLFATAAATIMASDHWFGIAPNMFDRRDGVILLMIFGVFLYYTVVDVVRQRAGRASDGGTSADKTGDGLESPEESSASWMTLGRTLGLTVAGLGALILGADFTVESAVSVAAALGVPEVVIGLTVLAVGTSLPELVASLVASLRGQVGLAIGNVVGSNIFNLLLVAGVTATIRPIPLPASGGADLAVLAFLSLALLAVSVTQRNRIVRTEGLVLLTIYMGYLVWRAGGASGS